jgi:hypothetical protein
MQKDTIATARVKRYCVHMALSTMKADALQAAVPVEGGFPAKLAAM